jgi:drug/metabolite transporter (DMT)-like permease
MSLMKKYSPITIMKWMFVYASICFIPFSYNDLVSVPYEQFSWPVYWRLGFVVLIATFFSYILIMIGQKNLRPTVVSIYNYIQPIVASIVVVVVGMDTFGPVKAVAVVLVFLGVYVVNQSRSREQMEAYEKLKEEKNKFT